MQSITNLNWLKKSRFPILFGYFLICLACVSLSFWLVVSRSAGAINYSITPYLIILLAVVATSFLFLFARFSYDKACLFLAIAIPVGLFFLLFILPTDVPDEKWHIFRTMTVFEDNGAHMVVPVESQLNVPDVRLVYADFYGHLVSTTDWNQVSLIERDMSSYLSIHYLVSGILYQIAKMFGANYWVSVYAASFGNLVIFWLAGYYFVRYIPFGKNASLIFLLNPMLIQQEASCSADSICNIFAISFILLLFINYVEDGFSKRNSFFMLVFAVLLSLSKIGAYLPLCLIMLVFLMKIRDKRKRYISISVAIVVGVITYIYIVYIYDGSLVPEARELMRDPSNLFFVLGNTLNRYFLAQLSWYFGECLGSWDISIPSLFWQTYAVLQIAVLLIPEKYNGKRFGVGEKMILTFICLVEIFALYMTQVWWTQNVDHVYDAIMGVQGRYFIPVFIVLLLAFCRLKNGDKDSQSHISFNVDAQEGEFNAIIDRKQVCVHWLKDNWLNVTITLVMMFVYYGNVMAILNRFGM